jgi:membrane protein required for colicin V production
VDGSPIQVYDIIMLVVLLGATLFGAWKGMAWQVASLGSLALSCMVAARYGSALAPRISNEEPWNRFIAMLILFVGTGIAVWLLFRLVAGIIDRVRLREFDRQMGALIGLAKGVLLCLVITFFAVTLSESIRQSVLRSRSGYYAAILIQKATPVLPSEVRDALGKYIDQLDRRLTPTTTAERSSSDLSSLAEASADGLAKGGEPSLTDALTKRVGEEIETGFRDAKERVGEEIEHRFRDAQERVGEEIEDRFKDAFDSLDNLTNIGSGNSGNMANGGSRSSGNPGVVDWSSFDKSAGAGSTGSASSDSRGQPSGHTSTSGAPDAPLEWIDPAVSAARVIYVVRRTPGRPDQVWQLPLSAADETVRDAIGRIPQLANLADKEIWISRPGAGGGREQILPVDWNSRTRSVSPATNFRIVSGDRIVIADAPRGNNGFWR